jgi:hypothetical protein
VKARDESKFPQPAQDPYAGARGSARAAVRFSEAQTLDVASAKQPVRVQVCEDRQVTLAEPLLKLVDA